MTSVPRRLVFGEVAELYDLRRPSYPAALVDDLLAESGVGGGRRALEVGAGTGKATELFASRGIAVLAVEPSPEMAAVARRKLAAIAGVEIAESDFEHLDLRGESFPLLYSATAWHWVDPQQRYRRAREALAPGGLLAAFWNRVDWSDSELRRDLAEAYERITPDMPAHNPMHPANPAPVSALDWAAEIAGAAGFADPVDRVYRWSEEYTPDEYAGLLATHSEFRLLDADRRERLLEAVRAVILRHGGTLAMPMAALLHTARAVPA